MKIGLKYNQYCAYHIDLKVKANGINILFSKCLLDCIDCLKVIGNCLILLETLRPLF